MNLWTVFKALTNTSNDPLVKRDLEVRWIYKEINRKNTQTYGLFASELAFYTSNAPIEALAMYAEMAPYMKHVTDIKDIVRRIEKRSTLIGLDSTIDLIQKHDLDYEENTPEFKHAVQTILDTLPAFLQEQYGHLGPKRPMTFDA